jgi:hypothetical protein
MQGAQGQRVDDTNGAISRNHSNKSDLQYSQASLQIVRREVDSDTDTNHSSPGKAGAKLLPEVRNVVPHHPPTRWICFDPPCYAWLCQMECWGCVRLMKSGETLI